MDSVVMQILAWALPSGFLSSVVTWLVTRRQRNNDFLASLQKSIDLLTEKYTETLNENVRLQADNAHLLANQKVMEEKIDALNKKIDQLTKQLKTQNEKSNSGNSPRSAPRRSADGGVRSNQEHDERADGLVGAEQLRRAARSAGRHRSRHASACAAADADGLDDDTPGVCGTGSGGADGHDDSDAEPP
jgi:chromosome segregation ATPase